MRDGDIMHVPTQDGQLIPMTLTQIEADHQKVLEIEAGQARIIGMMLRSGDVTNIALGQATGQSWEVFSKEQAEKRRADQSQIRANPESLPR